MKIRSTMNLLPIRAADTTRWFHILHLVKRRLHYYSCVHFAVLRGTVESMLCACESVSEMNSQERGTRVA
jgi:hypothetical protein